MILTFLAGVRETEGKEGCEKKAVVNVEINEIGTDTDHSYQDAVAAVLERIAVHSGAANSWCEVRKSAAR